MTGARDAMEGWVDPVGFLLVVVFIFSRGRVFLRHFAASCLSSRQWLHWRGMPSYSTLSSTSSKVNGIGKMMVDGICLISNKRIQRLGVDDFLR